MVKVYLLNVSQLPDPKEFPEILYGLDERRVNKILRYRQKKDRKLSLGAGILMKKCLSEKGISLEDVYYGPNGKPEVMGTFFNLSHSCDMVICAVSEKPVGCDIEKIHEVREGIAERFFSDIEIRYLNQFEEDKKTDEFYRIWTMKESYLKMTGHIMEYDVAGYKMSVCSTDDKFEPLICISL